VGGLRFLTEAAEDDAERQILMKDQHHSSRDT
jgi:hypothetical protein